MSENKKNLNSGEPLSEDQLDTVSGGVDGAGTNEDPYRSNYCWFEAGDAPRADGRISCKRQCMGKFGSDGKPVGTFTIGGKWYRCFCWGSDRCIDKWHEPHS